MNQIYVEGRGEFDIKIVDFGELIIKEEKECTFSLMENGKMIMLIMVTVISCW